ncbi:MAG: hypothetical protein HY671_14990 [Chloroflexi bacterium]|nr:hypothetical protein [Chloroflexota bacterium]
MSEFDAFQRFKDAFEDERGDYEPFQHGDRHGSNEWTWCKKPRGGGNDLARFVVLAVTPEGFSPFYRVEIWAGADDGESFVRSPFASFEMVDIDGLRGESLVTSVKAALQCAAARANSIRKHDLTTRRIPVASG